MNKIRVLAIVGAVLAILSAVLSCSIAYQFAKFGEFSPPPGSEAYRVAMAEPLSSYDIPLFIPAALCVCGGALGILAAVLTEKKNRPAGTILIISSVISIFTIFGITATILFIIAAVFSFSSNGTGSHKLKANGFRKAAITLCIIGAVLSISISLVLVFIAGYTIFPNDNVIASPDSGIYDMILIGFILDVIGLAGGVLGVFSVLALRGKIKKAGVLMIIAAVLCVRTCWYIPSILFIISAVLTFVYANKQNSLQPVEENTEPADS